MIDAKELRIGNLVENYKNDIVSIDRFSNLESYYTHDSNCYSIRLSNPITLTEEWLLKFGAVKRFASEWDYHLSIGAIKIYFRYNKKWYCELEGIYLDSKIQYVHQLQNIYFDLTCKELEIKL